MGDWLDETPRSKPNTVEHRVVGPPGCGKTTWLARQCQIAAGKYSGAGVCVGSLTRAAAAEVAGRDTGIPPQNVGTLHAHAYRALQRPSIMETADGIKGFNAWVGVNSYRISNRAIADPENASTEAMIVDSEGDQLLADMGVLRQLMTPREAWPPLIQSFAAKWDGYKTHSGRVDFTDLIEGALDSVDVMPGDPDIIMLDEAQDMSRLEMALARKWGESAEQLVIVGDPDQALYTWRGADPEAVFGSEAASVMVLSQSYRVPAAVHAEAVSWIERMPGRLPITYSPRQNVEGSAVQGEVVHRTHEWQDPAGLIDAVRADLSDGRTVMVLTSCNYMLHPLTRTLKELGMPFHNPYRVTNGAWNPLRAGGKLLAYLRPDERVWGDESRVWTWDDMRLWTDPLQAKTALKHGAKSLIKTRCIEGRFGKEDTRAGETVPMADLGGHLLTEEGFDAALVGDVDWWESQLRHLERKKQAFPLAVARRHGAALLRERPSLIVGTVHSVKGGEADVVYVFPDLSPAAYWDGWKLDPELEQHKSIVRLFYVAMTRAREKLVLCGASSNEAVSW